MIRVSKVEEGGRTVVMVDGQISAESVNLVEACCQQAMAQGKPVCLFLRDVSGIDPSGCTLLKRLAANGVRLLAAGVYTSYIVRSLRLAAKTDGLRETR